MHPVIEYTNSLDPSKNFKLDILDIIYYAFLYLIGLLVLFKTLTFLFTVTVAYVFGRRNPPQHLEQKNS